MSELTILQAMRLMRRVNRAARVDDNATHR
jgi:hypothetical protein